MYQWESTMRTDLAEIVMQLHNIARLVEQGHASKEIGKELRKCADKVHEVSVEIDREEYKDKE